MCRVPIDLLDLFPNSKIYKSLKTSDEKDARLLASSLEFQTQKLFLQLRSGMLSPAIKKELVTRYLNDHLFFIENDVNGYVTPSPESGNKKIDALRQQADLRKSLLLNLYDKFRSGTGMGRYDLESAQNWTNFVEKELKEKRMMLVQRKTDSKMFWRIIERRINRFNYRTAHKKDRLILSDDEKQQLYVEFLKAEIQILEVKSAAAIGDLKPLNQLKESVTNDLDSISKGRVTLSKVINEYQSYYRNSKPNIKIGTMKDMVSECEVLLDIIGEINIVDVNTIKNVDKVKAILGKYPRNKKQIFGDTSIHNILKTKTEYVIISLKTANEPLKRLRDIIDFAIRSDYITSANKIGKKDLFKVDRKEKPRKSYDKQDIEKLVDALCTKDLWKYAPPQNDRFWVILIALFHGFRLGNIVNLTTKHIVQDEAGWPCFDLRMFAEEKLLKTKNASMLVPIHEGLLLIGFDLWLKIKKEGRLFSDTVPSFSKWYNRKDKSAPGFEPRYVTEDPDKCLYSARHYFSNDLQRADVDHKMIQEMMGHARAKGDVTSAHYLDRAETSQMKEALNKMKLVGIDLDRLEARANELFNLASFAEPTVRGR
jgi:integrase